MSSLPKTHRSTMTWRQAWQQARAEMADPKAVVWLGPEIAQLLHGQQPEVPPEPPPRLKPGYSLWLALPLVILLMIPSFISYLHAYRRIVSLSVR
jgi:hypothetical protein